MTINLSDNTPRIEYTVAAGVTQTTFAVPFEFFNDADLTVYVDGVAKAEGTDFTITGGDGSTGSITFVTADPGETQQVTGASGGSTVVIVRDIAVERTTDFSAGSNINRAALNEQLDTIIGMIADVHDKADRTLQITDSEVNPGTTLPSINARKGRVIAFNSTTGAIEAGPTISSVDTVSGASADIQTVADNIATIIDAPNQASAAASSASAASTSASNAATSASAAASSQTAAASSAAAAAASETAAAASETAAAASESAAATSASNAATSASNAATSATNAAASASAAASSESHAASSEGAAASSASAASSSASAAASSATSAASSAATAATQASNAQTAADTALAALDSFDDRYLGQKTSDPTLDNDGNALVAGALYFNTTDDVMKVYEGSVWVAAYASLSGALLTANNLSDLSDAAAARTNLGLGTAATYAATSFIAPSGGAMTGDLDFGDSVKATFGTGEDMWIYHDGGSSYIYDRGTGNLRIITNSTVSIDGVSGGEFMAQFVSNGAVSLYYDNSKKFETTSTGVDVTGTVTADGLTVDGTAKINSTLPVFVFNETDTTDLNTRLAQSAGAFYVQNLNDAGTFTGTFLKVDNATGDISFYEDTGTTPRFFWDASAEALGIGTTSPSAVIHATNSGGLSESLASFEAASTRNGYVYINGDDNRRKSLVFQSGGVDKFSMGVGDSDELSASSFFIGSGKTGGSGADLVIDSSGNVGIGTSSPADKLVVIGTGSFTGALQLTANSTLPAAGAAFYRPASNTLGFVTASTERMRIDSSGNLGVGITNPAYKTVISNGGAEGLEIGPGYTSGKNLFQNYNRSTSAYVSEVHYASEYIYNVGGSERLRIGTSGEIGLSGANYGTAGQVLTSNGSGAAPSWQSALPPSTAGAIGTYGFFKHNALSTVAFGSTTAGSNLTPAGFLDSSSQTSGAAQSGTWRCMGYSPYANYGGGSYGYGYTLWVRIS